MTLTILTSKHTDCHTHTLCGQKRRYCCCSRLPTLRKHVKYKQQARQQRVLRDSDNCSASLMLCHCFSPYTVISCHPSDSTLICSTAFNIQVAPHSYFVSCLMTQMSGSFVSFLWEKLLFQLIQCKQRCGECSGVESTSKLCLIQDLSHFDDVCIDRGTNFLSLTDGINDAGNLQETTPGL